MEWNGYKQIIKELLDSTEIEDEIINIIKATKKNKKKIFIAGNGGSGATAAHFSCDLDLGASKPNYLEKKERFSAIPLTNNMPLVTALANDFGYDEIFKQQLINLAQPGDVFIAISGSGNSENIVKAVNYARKNGIITIGICGYDGGKLKKISDYSIHVKSNLMEACEDIHSIIAHFIALRLREE